MENNNKMIKTDKTQIEKIFEEGRPGDIQRNAAMLLRYRTRSMRAGRAGVREDSGVHSLKINDYVIV